MMMPSQHCRWVVVAVALVSVLLLWGPAGATQYAVGGDGINGWDTGTNYAAWAQAQSFAAGDVLVFEYVKSQHNVYEVTEAAYRSCDATAPGAVLAAYDSGFDKVVLPEANKTYWFICNVPHHCTGGMKLAVVTVSGAGAPGGGGFSGLAPEAQPSPSAGATGRSGWVAWAGLLVLALVNWAS